MRKVIQGEVERCLTRGKWQRRVHFYPDKSCTLHIKNMYKGPGLAWEQDEGLETSKTKAEGCFHFQDQELKTFSGPVHQSTDQYTNEEVERSYEEFYEDVHTEFLKFGEIVNFKVCKNVSFHLRRNVCVHYKSLESAVLACQFANGCYFAGKQINCEFVNLTIVKVAICGEYMKSRFKTCSHRTTSTVSSTLVETMNGLIGINHPKFWVKEMAALFGYSDEYGYEKHVDLNVGPRRNCNKFSADLDRHRSRRSRSLEMDHVKGGSSRRRDDENDLRESTRSQRHNGTDIKIEIGTMVTVGKAHITGADPQKNQLIMKTAREDRDQPMMNPVAICDESDKEWHHDHRRKHSQYRTEVSELSDDQGESAHKLKENFHNGETESERSNHKRGRTHKHSSKRSCSGRENNKAGYWHSKSNGDHESGSPGQCDERCISINKNDHLEPVSPEYDQNSRRKTIIVQSYESSSPGQYNGRSKSQDLASEYFYNDKDDDDDDHWESNEYASEEHHQSRSKSTCDDKRPIHWKKNRLAMKKTAPEKSKDLACLEMMNYRDVV
ncbi:hypothetical protein Q3G72_022850 [Acer saccharum]|nr:hypothetical protein Q3G72_021147 [Acer saccharum]KAK1583333.1 hypothetical protein Q3G72_022850 [Acer saccharum]